MTTHFWVIDSIHTDRVVLVCDDGRAASTRPSNLPDDLEAQMVLTIESDADGKPDWSTAAIDRGGTERRRQQSAALVQKLRKSDQHGFIAPPE